MIAGNSGLTFGPVPSRRLGRSLGINNIPAKVCTYSCVYCQVGPTTKMRKDRRPFFEPRDIEREARKRLEKAAGGPVDYVTYVPDGEPTLDINLGRGIALLKSMKIPVGVITNSSLLWREEVRGELAQADWVSLKIDAVRELVWRKINRPHRVLRLSRIMNGILDFAESFPGRLVTETMLVRGLNDDDGTMTETADLIRAINPERAYLSIPTRPPAETWVRGPEVKTLHRLFQILAGQVKQVEYLIGYEGNAFAATGDVESDLLNITAVHPMREEAVRELLLRSGSSWDVVTGLIERGEWTEVPYEGSLFYLRRFAGDRKAES